MVVDFPNGPPYAFHIMIPQWIIERKRDGQALSEEDISFFIEGYVKGRIPDYQMSALAMAITLKGMSLDETVALTSVMWRSGLSIDTSRIDGPKIDKHSTGGIGDKISLALAPLAACCGVVVPMIAGRGLEITGGTLDKLESIPGYRTGLNEEEFVRVLQTCGCSIIGQTRNVAPADKKLYALRDVTGTVPSIPLTVSSILSKKLAEGIDGLVLDVKWGVGAFMKTLEDAEALARGLIDVGRRMNLRVSALITDMNQPLGRAVGNALEVMEVIDILKGHGPDDSFELTKELCSRMMMLADQAMDRKAMFDRIQAGIGSGQAFDRFRKMVQMHGGDVGVLDCPDRLCKAPIQEPVQSPREGFIQFVNAESIGRACMVLGTGRIKVDDSIDHAVGVAGLKKVGERVKSGEPLAVIHAGARDKFEEAKPLVAQAFKCSESPVEAPPLVCKELACAESCL